MSDFTSEHKGWSPSVPLGDGAPLHLQLMAGQIRDALAMVQRGTAKPAAIDLAMCLGAGYPQGPLAVWRELPDKFAAKFTHDFEEWDHAPAAQVPTSAPLGQVVGLIGTGTMAAGIAEAIIVSGRSVRILPPRQSGYARMTSVLSRSLARSVEKGRFTQEQANASLARLQFVDAVQQLSDVDLVIEAVKEDLQVKRAFFARLDNQLPPSTILATNTSSFRVADISAGLPKTRRLIALHFFNPAQAMKLVEVVVPPAFSEITGDICAWVRDLNKVPVICADTRGFIVNRLLLPFLNDAGLAHDSGILISEIEREMTEVAHHPTGPFALMDLIGLDVMASALDTLAEGERDPRMKPARSLRERIDTGALGRKSRAGFHQYGEAK